VAQPDVEQKKAELKKPKKKKKAASRSRTAASDPLARAAPSRSAPVPIQEPEISRRAERLRGVPQPAQWLTDTEALLDLCPAWPAPPGYREAYIMWSLQHTPLYEDGTRNTADKAAGFFNFTCCFVSTGKPDKCLGR
jgi:hypothetical protein